LVGKYIELPDAYKSIMEALVHAGATNQCKVEINPIHSEEIDASNVAEKLGGLNGILVAPGFGHRGIEGKILAVQYAREKNIPFFGICLGMQCSVIEFSRNVLGYADANSTEMTRNTTHPVIDLMEDQKGISDKGGTMRLGAYPCTVAEGSKALAAYKLPDIQERHRHRYELNNAYLDDLQSKGMKATGINPDTGLVEIVEISNHPWFIGVQFHPEYKSTVVNPHPLFVDFVKAAKQNAAKS
jgi:CTP synthase